MNLLKSLLFASIIFTLHACGANANNKPVETPAPAPTTEASPAASPDALPHFTVIDAAGKKLDLQSLKGKKVFVNLWATWCPPCRAEMPSIEQLYQASDKEKTAFVMLSLDNDFNLAKKYVATNGMSLPVYAADGDLPDLFAVNGIPTTFIFDETGTLIEQHEGSAEYNTPAYRTLFGAAN